MFFSHFKWEKCSSERLPGIYLTGKIIYGNRSSFLARLRDARQFNNLVQEAMELSKQVKWPTVPVDFGKLRGIIIIPRRCSPFYLCFTADGKTCSLEKVGDRKRNYEFYSMVHVTTIYARAEVHMALVKLLRYLGDKYLDDLNVMDEGDYWNKGDAAELRYQFGRIDI
jgi:hypothetical protein